MTFPFPDTIVAPVKKAKHPVAGAVLALGTLLALTACESTEGFRPGCPNVGILRDAGTLRTTGPDGQPAAVAVMTSLPAVCSYDDGGVTVSAALTIRAAGVEGRGPATLPVEYFVAVTDPNRNVIARQVFATSIDMAGGDGAVAEELVQFLPAPQTVDARYFEVLVGFILSPDQLNANIAANTGR